MNRLWIVSVCVAGCAAPQEAAAPQQTAFASAYLARPVGETASGEAPAPASPAPSPPRHDAADEIRGLLEVDGARLEQLAKIAATDEALDALLAQPIDRADLEALAWLRSPAVAAARERLEAARTGYRQSADLKDLVALYRSFLRATDTRVGPEASRRATASIAPYPGVDALSGELVETTVAIAFEELRTVIRDVVAEAERAHADAARLVAARRVVQADVDLQDSLVKVLRARVESGRSSQGALLAFEARLEALRTELAVLTEQRTAIRAHWNRLLSRPEDAALVLEGPPSTPSPGVDLPPFESLRSLALTEQQAVRIAGLRFRRQGVAVRLAETMTLPRMDVGSSRFERERAGEAGVQRGAVFPQPGRMVRPRWDFGVKEAQVAEMRAREEGARRELASARDAAGSETRGAFFALDAARRRWRTHETELVPLAERAYETTRGSYEGNRAGYLELLDSARELLRVRLGRVDARRDYAHARARLLQAVGVRAATGGKTK